MSEFITPSDPNTEPKFRDSIDLIRDEISKMCLSILNERDSGRTKSLPINERSLRRGINGESLDDKTVRTIACLFYKTEDFSKLLELSPEFLRPVIERANNRLTHNGKVSYEVASNPELIQLWNLCSGFGCTRALGESKFNEKFDTLINILEEHKLVTKSVLQADSWIMSGDMMSGREDLLLHYGKMFDLLKDDLLNSDTGRFIQFSGEMRKSAYLKLKQDMVEFFYERVRNESISDRADESPEDFSEEMVKFNFQSSLCDLNFSSPRGKNEIH